MGDYESRLYDVQLDINSLIERINRCDPSLCNENWRELTFDYNMDILKYVYQNIEVDEMFDVVTDLICTERNRLELEGKVEPYPSFDNDYGPLPEEPRTTLEMYANEKRRLLAAKRDEQETRERYAQQLMERKRDAWKRTQNVPITYFPDGTPDADEYEGRLADEVEDVLRENETLLRRLGEKEDEIKKLKSELISDFSREPEKAFNATGNECFTKAKMGLLVYTIASLKDGPTPTKTKLVSIISAIGGWEHISVGTEMKKAGFNQSDIDAVAKLFEDAMPNFASEIKKQISRRPKTKK